VLHPRFGDNNLVYLSYAEEDSGGLAGAAVARARLDLDGERAALLDLQVIWRQVPKTDGRGHYGHRIAFSPDGYLFISSGEKQLFDPAQDLQSTLGKIIRLNDDGSVPSDNPFAGNDNARPEIWSLGHRNPLGLAFDAQGQLWNTEMGPRGGDELNRVIGGANYGYPVVSEGRHYSGKPIPDHDTRPEFAAPAVSWNPVISPANLLFYSGKDFPGWRGSALIGGLAGVLVRVEFSAGGAREAERFAIWQGVRALAQAPDGTLWLLENTGENAGLVQITPK
jgi:glucose/arabinose dehydrogenase